MAEPQYPRWIGSPGRITEIKSVEEAFMLKCEYLRETAAKIEDPAARLQFYEAIMMMTDHGEEAEEYIADLMIENNLSIDDELPRALHYIWL